MHLSDEKVDNIDVARWPSGEHIGAGDMHVGNAVLDVEELGVQTLQAVHGTSLLGSDDPAGHPKMAALPAV